MQPQHAAPVSTFRRLLPVVGGIVALVVGVSQFDSLFRSQLNAPLDFAEYWTAGQLNAAGRNPYSGANVREVQRGLGLDDTAIMMWNPPWAISLMMPIGLLPFRTAYGVWVVVHLVLVIASAHLLWSGFGGAPRLRWVAYLLALTFTPTIFVIGSGQITAVVLFGLAGFLYFARNNRPFAAGACAALTAVKPHLLALFAVWLLLDATRSSFARRILLGGIVVGGLACIAPTVTNPEVWSQYWEATHAPSSADHHHISDWKPPLVGWWLRQAVPGQPFAVQWLPLAAILLPFIAWQLLSKKQVSERLDSLPWIVGVSLVAAPYGAWSFDLVLLLVPVLATAARLAEAGNRHAVALGLVCLVTVNAVSLVMMINRVPSEWYVWLAPCVLLSIAAVLRLASRPTNALVPANI
jgi:hypothetical protein